jgi:hypothetical protein
MSDTKMQCSAELVSRWAEEALASADAVDIIDSKLWQLKDGSAYHTLVHARRFVEVSLRVFALVMASEARVALKVGEPRR